MATLKNPVLEFQLKKFGAFKEYKLLWFYMQ